MNTWLPLPGLAESTALFVLTFLSEDAAVLSAAVMVAGGVLPWELAFAACFAGIWLGDLGLYGLARLFGAPFVDRFQASAAIRRSRAWFETRGSLVLVVSRFVPGLRLPSYLAAGAMGFSARSFALVTALAASVWVGLIVAAAHLLGFRQIPWIRDHALWLSAGAVATAGASMMLQPWLTPCRLTDRLASLVPARWRKWEFWPAWLFYAPVAFMYLWLTLRHRSVTLPTAANPGISLGGLVGESKYEILRHLQQACPQETAQTWLLPPGNANARYTALISLLESENVCGPFILKPDVGQRGVGVKLIRELDTARAYLERVTGPVLLQRYAAGPREAGVFYYRLPDESAGHIFAITKKIFPTVEGDGVRTVERLILDDPRASIIAGTYLRRFADRRHCILPAGESLKLVEAGNHAQGCIFRDGSHLATPELLATLDRVSSALPGFHIGRYDLRYSTDEDLKAGRNLTVIELNGAGAEATNIYDARNSLASAYTTLYRQWALIFRIGAINRRGGFRPASLPTLLREWRRTSARIAHYPAAD